MCLGVGLLGHMVVLFFGFVSNLHTVLHSDHKNDLIFEHISVEDERPLGEERRYLSQHLPTAGHVSEAILG